MNPKYVKLDVPFTPSYNKYIKLIRLDAYPDAEEAARILFDKTVEKLQPKSLIAAAYIESRSKEDSEMVLQVGTSTFRGKVLSELDNVHRLFPYIATCGNEMETYDTSSLDMLASFWLDTLKTMALGAVRLHTAQYVKDTYGIEKVSSVNPGSGNVDIWPVQELGGIFDLLDQGTPIGVQLTPSSLMVPNKTISGMFYESETTFTSCKYCERENCPGRKETFSGKRL
ncbi:MAG: hypothetical protein HQ557_08060 [Bacteroidetes bacterium]|nr:hypothetical protein [Bacteroidota bacterium]